MSMVVVDDGGLYGNSTHSPSQLSRSEGWQAI